MRKLLFLVLAAIVLPTAAQAPYHERPEVQAFIGELVGRHGFVEEELKTLFSRVERTERILQAIQPPPERPSWEDYRAQFVNEKRIAAGVAFWNANRKTLARAESEFGVPARFIVGIIGVETFYGRNTGRWRVVDALTTLAFDYPARADFFRSELEQYLLLAREAGLDVFSVRGSYAGAIGIPQFMPGSQRRFAVDFDGDGTIDLRASPSDAIGSVANFLRKHGWQPGGDVLFKVQVSDAARSFADGSVLPKAKLAELAAAGVEIQGKPQSMELPAALVALGTEYRVGLQNFYALTRYNRSALYASAVHDLGQAIQQRLQSAGK